MKSAERESTCRLMATANMKSGIANFIASSFVIGSAALAQSAEPNASALPAHRTGPYILGADISWVQEDEAEGSTYYDHGKQKDVFQILKDYGFNYIRLRVFVNPASPRGYAARSKEAFCDEAHTLAMAKRVRAAGMGLLVDFHYSDTWADPGKQFKPAAWENLDLPALKKALYDHTRSVLSALKEQGTTSDMVQIGNEVTNGLLWPDGRAKDHFDNFAELVKSGIAATRSVDPAIKVVLHHDKGNNNAVVRWWLDNLISRGVRFDIIGLSCNTDGPAEKWKANFDDLAVRYPQYGLLAAEYSYRKRELNDVVYNVPDRRGLGSFIWEPTRHHEAIFDREGRNAGAGTQRPPRSAAKPAPKPPSAPAHRARTGRFDTNNLINLYPQMAKDYGSE
jgi:arabinogalactan endo-1,4-beta-galactosidase